MSYTNALYDYFLEYGIATEKEISLVTSINGTSGETYYQILYSRTGYRTWDQYIEMIELGE